MTPQHGCHRLLHAYPMMCIPPCPSPTHMHIIAYGFSMHVHEVVIAGSGCTPRPTVRWYVCPPASTVQHASPSSPSRYGQNAQQYACIHVMLCPWTCTHYYPTQHAPVQACNATLSYRFKTCIICTCSPPMQCSHAPCTYMPGPNSRSVLKNLVRAIQHDQRTMSK